MKRAITSGCLLSILAAAGIWTGIALAEPGATIPAAPKNEIFTALRGLTGTWLLTKSDDKMPMGDKPATLVFKETSAGSAIVETMFPGADCEMVNLFTVDGKNVVMTHYCAMGNQPRMKASSIDKGVIKFEYVDGGNLKSRDDGHMDSVEITIDGDKLTEKWAMYHDGKVTGTTTFEFKKQK